MHAGSYTLDEKSEPPEQLVAGSHGLRQRAGRRKLDGVELGGPRPDEDEVRVLVPRLAAHQPRRRFAHNDTVFHFTPYDRFKLYKDSRRVKHWAPDLARTLKTRYLPVPLPVVLKLVVSSFAWKWGTLAEMLARELFGHWIDRDEPEMFWPQCMVHGDYR